MAKWTRILLAGWVALASPAALTAEDPAEKVLIRAKAPYTALVAAIESSGGRVVHRFRYVDGLAAEIPRSALPAIRALVGRAAIQKDESLELPGSVERGLTRADGPVPEAGITEMAFDAVEPLDAAGVSDVATAVPQAYLVNNALANVTPLHAAGVAGQGMIVAVIDSGIRPGFPHISGDGSVIGCEDFVGDALGCSNFANDGHGTFVAGMISANVVFILSPGSAFRNAILAECPGCFLNPPTNTAVPMIGTAPLSSIYALRVFAPTGGAPSSRIIAAMERAIELREKFDAGEPGGRNIRVANLSLGGDTIFPGRDLLDQALDAMLEHDIVPVVAAGNTGPSSLTMGSPASANGALTVGAANLAHNERIFRRLQLGPVVGPQYRASLTHQTAFFSGRGPNADGRIDPDVIVNGFANFGQGTGTTTGSLSIGSGTSYATPSISGVAAVLRQAFPSATARQVREAIIASANPSILHDGSTPIDQGAGYVDGVAAAALLATGTVLDLLAPLGGFSPSVQVNVQQGTDLKVKTGLVQESFTGLRPGQRHDILYKVAPNTAQVVVTLAGVTPALPPSQQNPLFGDDILLTIHSAKTSAIGAEGDYPVFEFTKGGSFIIDNPEPGLMRATINGDWTNAGTIGGFVYIFSLTDPLPGQTLQSKLLDGQAFAVPVQIPAGVATAEFKAAWRSDWGTFPAADVDMILVRPDRTLDFSGATINIPERVTVTSPAAGQWIVVIDGFAIPSGEDKVDLRVVLDGKVVK